MRLPFLRKQPDPQAEIYSEAQALLDDGLELDFVLSLFPGEDEWLAELLETSTVIGGAYATEEPSYYFEASLKAKFVAGDEVEIGAPGVVPAAEGYVAAPIPAARFSPVRTAFASVVVLIAAVGIGGTLFGFVTADDSVPGDWNYAFKLASERLEYSLSRGDGRVDVQINHAEARIYEIQRLNDTGQLTTEHIDNFTRELSNLLDLAAQNQLDSVQAAKANSLRDTAFELLRPVRESQDETLAATAEEAIITVDRVIAAATGDVGTLVEPTPTAVPDETVTSEPQNEPTTEDDPAEEPEPSAESGEE